MPRVANTLNIKNPKRYGYDIRIDDMLLRSAISPNREMIIQSSEVGANQQVNVKQNAEDFTTNLGRIYSRNNFSGGSNLDTAHRRDGNEKDVTRFWDSKGIDVFHSDNDTSYHIKLLNKMTGFMSELTGSNNYLAQTTDNTLYITDETDLWKSTDNGENWTEITATGASYNFTGIAVVGNTLYLTTADGTSNSELIQYDGSSFTTLTTAQASSGGLTGVWFAKGFLFISGDNGTVELLWAVNPFGKTWSSSDLQDGDAIFTFEDTHHVSAIVDAGAVVLAASTNGDIYSIKDVSGTMTLKGQTNIPFEEIHSIAASEGQIFFGTKEKSTTIGRFYRAQLVVADDLYVLGQRQLVKEWDVEDIDTTPYTMFVSRDSVYMGIQESSTESFLWRYYLPTAGIARDLNTKNGGKITGITNSDGNLAVLINDLGFFKQGTDFEDEGYLVTAAADFFTAEQKQFVGAEVSTFDQPINTEIDLSYSTKFEALDNPDDSSYKSALKQTIGTGEREAQLTEVSRYIVGKLTLKSTNNINTPKLKSLQFRALARPELVVVQIPINLSDRVERPGRKPLLVKGLGNAIYAELKTREGSSVTLELFDPKEIIRGVVERISYPINSNVERGSVTQYAIITVRGTRQPDITEISSNMVFGISPLGQMRFGA
tara:strand:+ start:51 stop:2021 length:1971 start_codon:yes stop_codon:yes gene_type:complete